MESKKKTIEDFEFIKGIGEGAFGTVYLAKEKETQKLVAVKALDKNHIIKYNKTKSVYREKDILNLFRNHPNDKQNLYFVFEHCPNGTLSGLIKKNERFSEEVTKIYAAEIINVLEHIHTNNVMHRDLKPENILITQDYHLKVIDFGDAAYIVDESENGKQTSFEEQPLNETEFRHATEEDRNGERRGTFVGTALYVSPEMLNDNKAMPASDLWALGCTIYKMLTGDVPFNGQSDYHTFQLILSRKLSFRLDEENKLSEEAKNLIDQLLQLKPEDRLGAGPKSSKNDYQALKQHPFFKDLDFGNLNSIKVPLTRKISDSDISTKNQNPSWTDVGAEYSKILVHEGELKKKNKYFWNQLRTFRLFRDGKLNYYKDKALYRGQIVLCADTKVVKTGRDKFEIICPQRTFLLSEDDSSRLSSDKWIEKIREVIAGLKK